MSASRPAGGAEEEEAEEDEARFALRRQGQPLPPLQPQAHEAQAPTLWQRLWRHEGRLPASEVGPLPAWLRQVGGSLAFLEERAVAAGGGEDGQRRRRRRRRLQP